MYPDHLKYSKEHEWVKVENDIVVIGITDYAQEQLGDVVYVELPEVGTQLSQFEVCGTIESVKTVSDLYVPVSGEVIKINEGLDDTPELMNSEPYGAGWIFEVQLQEPGDLDKLMASDAYEAFVKEGK